VRALAVRWIAFFSFLLFDVGCHCLFFVGSIDRVYEAVSVYDDFDG